MTTIETRPGAVTWYSSEDDGPPDVGVSLAIGGNSELWVGEISRHRYSETPGSELLGSDNGWWVILYEGDSSAVIGKAVDADAARHLIDTLQPVVGTDPPPSVLSAALRPLAKLPIGGEIEDDPDLVLYVNAGRSITVSDVLQARAALAAAPAPSFADLGVLEAEPFDPYPQVAGENIRLRETLEAIADEARRESHRYATNGAAWVSLRQIEDKLRAALATREAQAADPAPVSDARCKACGELPIAGAICKRIDCPALVSAPIAEADVLRAALAKAMQTLENYGDPSGYADGDGEVPEPDMGALARETVAEIRAVLNAERQP